MARTPTPGTRLQRVADEAFRLALGACASLGKGTLGQFRKILQLLAIASAVVTNAFQPSSWRRTIRTAVARNVVSSGVEAIGIIFVLGVALGILLVVQYQVWVGGIVESRWLGSVWVAVIVRELGPLLVNLVVIGRSGSSMAAEMALIHVSGEDRVVEGQGLDLLDFFVFPRAVGLMISVGCLSLIFAAISFLSVFIGGQWIDAKTGTFLDFARDALGALSPADIASLLFKSTVPALLTGCICCAEGLGADDNLANVPRASRIAVQRSVITLFIVSAFISVIAYL